MNEHEDYVKEKHRIDELFDRGYTIEHVEENLDGAFVTFRLGEVTEVVNFLNANARKYFSTKMIS
ncbi:hypothetical protein [Geomicrobium sp. JCM 19038]|uniref:hypothetical protein n=1 Tax=Geomicrobium sp. JCM 19038 TaxID=1460635 RepID=UPI00045F383C|nr:hypothetical protein [Geomicrobium sp. JCM 19038]GAK10270.1 hypothetical protein JCM19038_4159 [Geomicrobium sp. JCM 19038]